MGLNKKNYGFFFLKTTMDVRANKKQFFYF